MTSNRSTYLSRLIAPAVACAVMAMGMVDPAYGQTIQVSEASTVTARVGVVAQIGRVLQRSLPTNNLSFGQIAATSSNSRSRVDKASPDAGRFEVHGSGDQSIRVSYVAPTQLRHESGAGVIGITLELYGAASLASISSSQRHLQNETVALAAGRYFFFVGGELNIGPLTTNPPGVYTGEFELEVSYVDL